MSNLFEGFGEPDFSRAYGMIGLLPPEIRNRLSGKDHAVLSYLVFLIWKRAHRKQAAYAYCSEEALARQAACSVRTVKRSVADLQKHGLIRSKRRAPAHGQYQTNLWSIGATLASVLLFRQGTNMAHILQGTNMAHNNLKRNTSKESIPLLSTSRSEKPDGIAVEHGTGPELTLARASSPLPRQPITEQEREEDRLMKEREERRRAATLRALALNKEELQRVARG